MRTGSGYVGRFLDGPDTFELPEQLRIKVSFVAQSQISLCPARTAQSQISLCPVTVQSQNPVPHDQSGGHRDLETFQGQNYKMGLNC